MTKDPSVLTIENLSIEFDVAANDQEAAFSALFRKYIDAWHRQERDARQREKLISRARAVVESPQGDD
jgi:hypothetical protein